MKRKMISFLLVFVMLLSLFPMAALAYETEENEETVTVSEEAAVPEETIVVLQSDADAANGENPEIVTGSKGENVAVMVYGKAISEAVFKSDYNFDNFLSALESELQGVLANEKIPHVELYLVSDSGAEYKLTENAVKDAAFLSSFKYEADGILGWSDDVFKFLQDVFGWMISGVDTIGELYRIYGATNVPKGSYTLEVRQIDGEGYTLWQPESGQIRVKVGGDHVNYVGYNRKIGEYDLEIFGIDLSTVKFSMPGVFLNAVDPGFSFRSADLGGNGIAGTEFVLVNRDEVEKIVKASLKLGKETFTNAMDLVGTEGFTWDELNILDKDLLKWDEAAQQISFNEDAAYKLLVTYWSLVEASARMPMTDFLSDETDLRLPAILKATSDTEGYVKFTEDSNVTLLWSLQILLKMGDIILTEADNMDLADGVFKDAETEAIVEFVITLAKYAAEEGIEFWDENGKLINGIINDWVYPVLQNDNIAKAAKNVLVRYLGNNLPESIQEIIAMLPTHALLTAKMPAGHYIMMETAVPDGYFRSPIFYTMNMEWRTESPNIQDWCYVTVGNIGTVLPYYAEDFYTYFREFSAAGTADEILNKITDGKTGTIIEDTINGNNDITALSIAYNAGLIYNYMGGDKVYGSEEELAKELTTYLYTYGRTSQNLMMFANKVVKEAKSVITSEIDDDWTFYTASTSLRTNLALKTKALIKGIADCIDTSGNSKLNANVKDALTKAADNIDTSNRIVEQTTAIKNAIENTAKSVAADIGNAVLKIGMGVTKTILKWAMK